MTMIGWGRDRTRENEGEEEEKDAERRIGNHNTSITTGSLRTQSSVDFSASHATSTSAFGTASIRQKSARSSL